MIAQNAIEELSASMRRLREGSDPANDIVRWLRAFCETAETVPAPAGAGHARGYTRTLIHKNDAFEIVVIHWMPGCVTPVHDHGGSHCWLSVASGAMRVENFLRYDRGEEQGRAHIALEGREELVTGGIDYRQDDVHLHRCITPEAATTLHVYAKPIAEFLAFDEQANTCSPVISNYDAVIS